MREKNRLAWLFEPVPIAPLVYLRIAFGYLVGIDAARYLIHGFATRYYVEPAFLFKYYGFEWVHPLPGVGIYLHFAALVILAACVAAGFLYRIAAPLLFLGFTWVFLLDQALYLNHFYLIALIALLLALVPAHRALSVDARLRPALRSTTAPAWTIRILQVQLAVVYVYGAIAKLNADWLLEAQPLTMWLAWRADLPILGPVLALPATAWFFSWAGLLFDLLVVPALLWRRTRIVACVATASFHLLNAVIFQIGIFPWMMLAATALLFLPGWRLARPERWTAPSPQPAPRPSPLVAAALAGWVLVQLVVPLRHWLYPGDVHWTEEGHRFSWRMKLRQKSAEATYWAVDRKTGERWRVPVEELLGELQLQRHPVRPDMVLQLAHWLAAREEGARGSPVAIHAEVRASLNGRPPQLLVDPTVDLAAVPRDLRPAAWILPLGADAPKERDSRPAIAGE